MRYLLFCIVTITFGVALTSCSDTDDMVATVDGKTLPDNIIHIGGIGTDDLVASAVTRAEGDVIDESQVEHIPAENIDWLRGPLFDGLDITYGKSSDRTTSRVAILKLLQDPEGSGNIKYWVDGDSRLAEYSFLYRDDEDGTPTDIPAIWYDNGPHFFEGLYIPERIKYDGSGGTVADVNGTSGTAAALHTDQHNDATEAPLGNYTLLSHYLGMPSNFTINATVARVKLPFRHRLARVLAYILIEPDMGSGVKLDGYNYVAPSGGSAAVPDDPSSTQIRFCNVNVLAGVKDVYNAATQHHTYTPQWTEVRKAVPHFVGERGSYDDSKNESYNDNDFIAYYNIDKKTYIYPTDPEWKTIHDTKTFNAETNISIDGNYEQTKYGTVPVYDLIVRPTYTTIDNVMYDEDTITTSRSALYAATNQIDFDLTLNNSLHYTKRFIFDLDANYQTVVYLHISREKVDYNSSGNDLWHEDMGYEDYYGVNNENGNNLSIAGSSWQRAYTNNNTNYAVTDGHQYLHDSEDEYAQYVTDAKWVEMLREAYEGGLHHGDYFILDHDITIPAAAFPEDFVFTGHLDGQNHTITIGDGSYTKVTHPASYVTYVQNEAKTVTKYFHAKEVFEELNPGVIYEDNIYMELIYAGEEFYEYDETTEQYTLISDIYAYDGDVVYFKTSDDPAQYIRIPLYMKVYNTEVTETVDPRDKPYYVFAGLDGKYSTAQESNMHSPWEANVHLENNNKWVPYCNNKDGWRAEIMNTNFVIDTAGGCSVFRPSAVWGTDVTGYLHNCWIGATYNSTTHKWSGGTAIPNYTPSIPEY